MIPEPRTVTNAALDRLPLFATDLEIATAIVGKQKASRWKREVIPTLERMGFPRWDPLHEGRPVPHVRQFYAGYLGITAGVSMAPPDGEDRVGMWLGKRLEKKIEDEERRRAAGEEVVELDPGTDYPKKLKAIAEYRAKKAAEFADRKAR